MESGQLKSPKFPNNYPNDKICYWTITVPFGFSVYLSFEIFEVSINPPPCKYDYVEIRDGGDRTSKLLGRFCGKTLPGSITSTGNQLFVKFHSDSSASKKGFSASFFTTSQYPQHQYRLCPIGQRISVFKSHHSNKYKDRNWPLECAPIQAKLYIPAALKFSAIFISS